MQRKHVWKSWFIGMSATLAIVLTPAPSAAVLKQFLANINGPQEVPPNASTALGVAHFTYDTATDTFCYSIAYTGALAGPEILAHIHGPAIPGVSAGVIIPLALGVTKQACIVAPALPFDKKQLYKNLYYVNIHSVPFPLGEIRGQILRIK